MKTEFDQFALKTSNFILDETQITQYDFYDGENLACTVQTFDWWDGKNLSGLEVFENYRGLKLSYSLLNYAVKTLGATNLAVEKDNLIAIHIYEKYGFVNTFEDDKYFYMSYEG